jgi:hypothetical protein
MFLAVCASCDRRELRGFRGIQASVNRDRDWELLFICRACGTPAVAVGSGDRNRTRGEIGTSNVARAYDHGIDVE